MKTEDEGARRACPIDPDETAESLRRHTAPTNFPLSPEEWSFQQLPFVCCNAKTGQTTKAWAPCEIPESGTHGYSERCTIGAFYAMELIGHARQSKDGDWVKNVCEEIVQRGKWTGVEIGFFSALGDFVASGTVRSVSAYFDAKPIGDAS